MGKNMFCYQCQETAAGKGCTMLGVCGKKQDVALMQDLLIYVTRGLCSITSSLRNYEITIPKSVNRMVLKNLFSTITNANFCLDYFVSAIKKTLNTKQSLLLKVKAGVKLPEV